MAGFPSHVGSVTIYQGDTFTQTFNFKEADTPIDLLVEGWSGWAAQYRKAASSTDFSVSLIST